MYYRLHGSPHVYYSAYSAEYLDGLAHRLVDASRSAPVWCVFDNTALGEATTDALGVIERLARIERGTDTRAVREQR